MLTESQRQRMQRNREKALQLRKARIANLSDAEKYEISIHTVHYSMIFCFYCYFMVKV